VIVNTVQIVFRLKDFFPFYGKNDEILRIFENIYQKTGSCSGCVKVGVVEYISKKIIDNQHVLTTCQLIGDIYSHI
jgi:hypothetical protein